MPYHRYSPDYVDCVRNAPARDFLATVGLPARHVLFLAAESFADRVVKAGGRDLLKVGLGSVDDRDDVYCVDCETGAVAYLSWPGPVEFHVNASPQAFADCLGIFERETSRAPRRYDEAALELLAERLGGSMETADRTVFRDDPGFWGSILHDVAIGDYTDDEE